MEFNVTKYSLTFEECGEFIKFVIERSFIEDADGSIEYYALNYLASFKMAFLKFYTNCDMENIEFNDYINIDICNYNIDICQFITIENAVERQVSWELKKLLHSGKVKSKISLKNQ